MDPSLPLHLEQALRAAPSGPLCVAFSGGGDSLALLHALAHLPAARARGLRALHVAHGLHPDSSAWATRCVEHAACIEAPLQVLTVRVDIDTGEGIEAAARRARYAALSRAIASDELLLTAHHRDDQAETLLLRLLHGAGTEGLAGMRALRRFGPGWLWRPLLALGRETLRDYAAAQGLDWIVDPANADTRFARSWLRGSVLPQLAQRWPDVGARLTLAAERLREEDDVLADDARRALAAVRALAPHTLQGECIAAMLPALRRRVLGLWLDELGLPRPPAPVWARLEPELLAARPDAEPRLAWRGAELRRYRGLLYAMATPVPISADWEIEWDGRSNLRLPPGFGTLCLDPSPPAPLRWIVRPRRGGERIRLHDATRSELRLRLQEIGLPPWQRARLPLLFDADGELLAAGDLLQVQALSVQLANLGCALRWQPD